MKRFWLLIFAVLLSLIVGGNVYSGYYYSHVEVAGCTAGTYMFLWDANYGGDTDKGCFTDAGANKDGTVNGGTITDDYFNCDANDEYVLWVVAGLDGLDDDQGTVWLSFTAATSGANSLFESYGNGGNFIYVTTNAAGWFGGYFIGQNVFETTNAPTYDGSTWNRVGYTWQTGADAGGKHSVQVESNGWVEEVEDLDSWAVAVDDITIGDFNKASGPAGAVKIKDVIITSGYQDADSL